MSQKRTSSSKSVKSVKAPGEETGNAFTRNTYRAKSVEQNFVPEKLAAIKVRINARALKITRKLAINKIQTELSITCLKTGISGTICSLPAIPGFTLISEHPLAILENARGIAQRGRGYLKELDTPILAGLFITLCKEYDLLQTGSVWKAHEANASLRLASKPALLEGILLVEQWIHSKNSVYLPRLSLLPQVGETEESMAARILNWLKLLHDAIMAPDTAVYDPKAKIEKVQFDSVTPIKKKNRELEKKLVLARREFTIAKKILKEATPKLKSASSKLRNYLLTLATGTLLLNASEEIISLMILRLEACEEQEDAKRIITVLSADWALLKKAEEESETYGEFMEVEQTKTEENIPSSLSSFPVGSSLPSIETHTEENIQQEETSQVENTEEEPSYAGLSPIQALLLKKAWMRRTGRTQQMPFKTAEEENKKYSIPAGQIIGSAPVYLPSVEKQKLGKD